MNISHLSLGFEAAVGLAILYALFTVFQNVQRRREDAKKLPLPPRPPGHFLLGNLPEVLKATGTHTQHLLFHKWAKQYGEIFRVKVGPLTEYFINSDMAVKDIFDRQSSATAERPHWVMSSDYICGGYNVLLLHGSDPRWKHQRKVTHAAMTSVQRADAGIS